MRITVPVTKRVTYEVAHGQMHIESIEDTYYLTYLNPIFKGSPLKLPMQFSTDFTIEEIMKSSEVTGFLSRFE
jgi:hypothetical protein